MFVTFETCRTVDNMPTLLTEDVNRRTAAQFVLPLLHDGQKQTGIPVYKGLQDRVRS